MPFDKIEFELTDEQMTVLGPFAERINASAGSSVVAEMFICKAEDWRYRKVVVRFMDPASVTLVSTALVGAEKDYEKRQDRARRFGELKDILEARTATVTTVKDECLIVERDGHRYEVREADRTA